MDHGEEMERLNVSTNAIDVNNISFTFQKGRHVLNHVSFSLKCGDIMTILGPNGSGKTTLLNCLLNNYTTYSGTINLFNRDIKSYSPKEYAANMAYVPQLAQLSFDYSVEEFVLMGVNPHKSFFEQPGPEDYQLVRQSLEALEIAHLGKRQMGEVSGGERQLAYIARALTQQPKIIVMDEPTSALDYSNQYKVIKILKKLNREGYTVILTSHNPEYAFMLGGYVGMLYRNNAFCYGPVHDLMTDESLTALYETKIKVKYLPDCASYVCIRVAEEIGEKHD